MCGSTVDIQSPTAEIRRGKKKKKTERTKKDRNHRAKIQYPHLLHRAAIIILRWTHQRSSIMMMDMRGVHTAAACFCWHFNALVAVFYLYIIWKFRH